MVAQLTETVQLGHEELLLLLGILRLPMPVALGEEPTAGYSDEALNAALNGALGSLLARDYVSPPVAGADEPRVSPAVEALIAESALAERCLLAALERGGAGQVRCYSARHGRYLAHRRSAEGVHQLRPIADGTAIAEQLREVLGPLPPATGGDPCTVSATAFERAIEATSAGRVEAATAALIADGLDAARATDLVERLGPNPERCVLVLLTGVQSPAPQVETVVILKGAVGLWRVQEWEGRPDQLEVAPFDADGAHALVAALAERLVAAP